MVRSVSLISVHLITDVIGFPTAKVQNNCELWAMKGELFPDFAEKMDSRQAQIDRNFFTQLCIDKHLIRWCSMGCQSTQHVKLVNTTRCVASRATSNSPSPLAVFAVILCSVWRHAMPSLYFLNIPPKILALQPPDYQSPFDLSRYFAFLVSKYPRGKNKPSERRSLRNFLTILAKIISA